MSTNVITIFQGNTTALTCEISSSISLANFDTYFQVRKDKDDVVYINSTGSLDLFAGSYTGSYNMSSTETEIDAGPYYYEVFVSSGSVFYTVRQDNFIVKNSVVK